MFITMDDSADLGGILNELNDMFPNLNSDQIQSLYYSLSGLNESYTDNSQDFKLMHLNIRSLYPKIDNFTSLLQTTGIQFDIMCLSETWINNSTVNLISITEYKAFHLYRGNNDRGGGVSLFIHSSYDCELLENFRICLSHIECLFLIMNGRGKRIVVGVVYRPPSSSVDQFVKDLEYIIQSIPVRNFHEFFICGDFNLDLLGMTDNADSLNFANMMFMHCFSPTITKPTRVTENSLTLIDNIFSYNMSNTMSGIIPFDLSDHYLIFNIKKRFFSANLEDARHITCRTNTITALSDFYDSIASHDFSLIADCNNVDSAISMFDATLLHYYNYHCPIVDKIVSYKNYSKPWIDSDLRNKIKKRSNFYVLLKLGKMSHHEYNRYRNFVTKQIRDKKSAFFERKFSQFGQNMRQTWKLINSLIRNTNMNSNSNISLTDDSGNTISNPIEVANKFNHHFASVGQRIFNSFGRQCDTHLRYLPGNYVNSMYLSPVSASDIQKIIMSLKNKSCNINLLPVSVLKSISNLITPVLAAIINKSLCSGIFPSSLKMANVVPLHKGGDRFDVNNYRPISLLSTYSKVFEKVVYVQISNYFETNNIFYPHQYGFRNNRCTTHAMLNLFSDIYSTLDEGNLYFSMFLDLKKAFDSVSHEILLSKLSHYGVRGVPLSWLRSYLEGRRQSVIVNGVSSSIREVTCGVPQGSVLGGFLFLAFFNDFPQCTDFFKFNLFADDSTISFKFRKTSINNINTDINNNLIDVSRWLNANRILVNTNKTKYIVFSYLNTYQIDNVVLNGCDIEFANEIKFLGLTIDHNVTFSSHVNKISSTISKFIGVVARMRNVVPPSILLKMYYSFIHSTISYAIELWYNCAGYLSNNIFTRQKCALRILTRSHFNAHTAPLFEQLRILTVNSVFKYKLGLYFFKTLNSEDYDPALLNYITSNTNNHSHATRNRHDITLPRYNRSRTQNSFLYIGCKIWNEMDNNLKLINSYNSFKSRYKLSLLCNQ